MMKTRMNMIIGMIIVISGASIVGRVVQVISLSETGPDSNESNNSSSPEFSYDSVTTLGNKDEHLLWFLQVSDLHLSIFHDKSRVTSLERFVNETVSVINPSAVLASGDLTDAKSVDMLGSRQYIEEWHYYSNILNRSKVREKTVWLDIRGNHDNFDVPALSSSNNYYQIFSAQGPNHRRSYMYSVKKGFDSISFIAVDACLLPGPRRPFNFIGVLTNKEMKTLEHFKKESEKRSNFTVWFGHYPTSCIISPWPGLRKLMSGSLAYMCGHLHTLGGLARNLYTMQQTGSLELELGDWKDERLFRVAAVDHGLFSFIDTPLDSWPVILITNPKNLMFIAPQNEPLHKIGLSTHIRVMVWSPSDIEEVFVRIDDEKGSKMVHAGGPLYVAAWNPKRYQLGVHTILVVAKDVLGRRNELTHSFAIENSKKIGFRFWARAILMSNVSVVFQFLFGLSVCLCVIPMCVVRIIHHRVKDKKMTRPRIQFWLIKIWMRKLWILCATDILFWPLVFYSIYLPIGPWFIGRVLENHIGVVFAWGTFVYSSYLPGSLTYAYGFLQILLFQLPLIFITAHSADIRFQALYMNKKGGILQLTTKHLAYIFLIITQAMNAYFFWLAYGTMALILGPLRTWAVVLGIYMWYQSSQLDKSDLRIVGCIFAASVQTRIVEGNCFVGTDLSRRVSLVSANEPQKIDNQRNSDLADSPWNEFEEETTTT